MKKHRMEAIIFQILAGAVAAFGGFVVGVILYIYALSDALLENMSAVVMWLNVAFSSATSLLASSATVYGIGKFIGYAGKHLVTLLSGVLPTVGLIYLYFIGGYYIWGLNLPNSLKYFYWGSVLLPSIAETIGFHLSPRLPIRPGSIR